MSFISVENLTLCYGDKKILDSVSLEISKGDFFALIGPNGAGKSFLLKCVGGLNKKFSGSVKLEGRNVYEMSEKAAARRIAWVHQSVSETLPFTVREFAIMSRYPWHSGFSGSGKGDSEAVDKAIETASVEDIADRRLDTLSGGERQKALIAAALAQSTDILFLDEPASFLDYRHQAETLSLIEKINQKENITVLLVTHDINFALHGANKCAALKKGRVVWQGESMGLLNKNVLDDIFDTGFELFLQEGKSVPYAAPKGLVR